MSPLFILYVEAPLQSAPFYAALLGSEPLEAQATFAMFQLEGGARLGLWSRHTVEPAAERTGPLGGQGELCFRVADVPAVDAMHSAWTARGITIIQAPLEMDFGYTFTGLDPDGHRLRVYALL